VPEHKTGKNPFHKGLEANSENHRERPQQAQQPDTQKYGKHPSMPSGHQKAGLNHRQQQV
jgi:hypothetical protein